MFSDYDKFGASMFNFDPATVIDDLSTSQIQDMEKMIQCLLVDPIANPLPVQQLIAESAYGDVRGKCAYALLGLYAIGKVEWVPGDPWTGKPGGWVSIKSIDDSNLYIN